MLETQLQELNQNISSLIQIMQKAYSQEVDVQAHAYREAKAIEVEPAEAAPAPAAASATTPATEPATNLSADDVRVLILDIVKKGGRDAAVRLLGQFGVSTAPELKAEQYSAFMDAGRKVLAEA